jgi:type III restriction enzyme
MIELRDYQIKAINKLKNEVNELLESTENKTCIFKAPTGSGKTIMIAEFLKRLVKDRTDDKKFSFIWITVRMLHEQSKDKLEKYYVSDRTLKCSYFEDLENKMIGENEILFFNWSSINKKEINLYVKENEQDNYLNPIVKNTKEEGREIILIIDESHHTASSEKSKELIEIIGPKVTLEVSATPHLTEYSAIVEVELARVKEEEMIKSEISINPEFKNIKVNDRSTDEIVIDSALKKRKELLEKYKEEGSKINPLVLIQLPDKREGLIDKKEEIIKILKEKFNISENNGKLAIWLSEEKSDILPNIEKNDNEVEVLIFKQAIAVGWDCPRASILVLFREWKSIIFSIQTVGRIMRMPEFKYYQKNPELNKGYVFTNVAHMSIAEDIAKDYITFYEAKRRNEIYKNISLNSIHLKRQREKTRLSGKFSNIFLEVAEKINLKKNVSIKPSPIVNEIMVDGKIINVDKVVKDVEHEGTIGIKQVETELQNTFDLFIIANCTPFAPADSSGRIKTAIYSFFEKVMKIKDWYQIQKIVLSKENNQYFINAINKAKEEYSIKVVAILAEKREVERYAWEIPIILSFNSRYQEEEHKKSIMKPTYVKKASKPEIEFIELLDNSKKVKWWFKNGESEKNFFAVLYKDVSGKESAFYVDFIVMFENGRIGLFDTKGGITAKDAKTRAEGLAKYIKDENKKGKRLWGGIVINVKGSWRYNDNETYRYDENNLKEWKFLEI